MESFPAPALIELLVPGSRSRVLGEMQFAALARDFLAGHPPSRSAPPHVGALLRNFGSFLNEAYMARHPMDWTLHLEYALYDHRDEAAVWAWSARSAVRRWVRSENTGLGWIFLAVPCVELVAIGRRSESPVIGPTVMWAKMDRSVVPDLPAFQVGRDRIRPTASAWKKYIPTISTRGK